MEYEILRHNSQVWDFAPTFLYVLSEIPTDKINTGHFRTEQVHAQLRSLNPGLTFLPLALNGTCSYAVSSYGTSAKEPSHTM